MNNQHPVNEYEKVATPINDTRLSTTLADCSQQPTLHLEDEDKDLSSKTSVKERVVWGIAYGIASLAGLYFFMVAIRLIGDGITLALGCDTRGAFDFANNPVAGLMIGTVATALLHSSGTVTSIIVALVGSGGMTIRQGVYVVMGANVGTCITCIIVAFGQVGDRATFQRAMAAATVHDMYNLWSVFVMFPLEIVLHPLERLSVAMSNARANGGAFNSPVDAIVNPLATQILVVDRKTIYKVASGEAVCTPGQSFTTGGIFNGSSMSDGSIGAITAIIGFCILVCALLTLVKMLAKVFMGPTKRIVSKLLEYNGYVNIVAGTVITFCVHSSTVVTSTLTPLAGLGVVTLEQVYPLVIGANLGTTGTALLAALVTGRSDSIAIALVHFWFNLFGIVLFYPIPITRKPILYWARSLAYASAAWPMTAVLFLVYLFLLAPGILLVLVYMCTADGIAVMVIGYILAVIVIAATAGSVFWYTKKGGRPLWHAFLEKKGQEREAAIVRETV